jgi:RNA polymerase sigma-70 factor (ECF subfamily)
VVTLLPDEAEGLGLLALMLFLQSRSGARRSATGEFVPLSEQHPKDWNSASIDEAERLLRRASGMNVLGRYQLEAAIQSAHAARRFLGRTDWPAIVELYIGLHHITQSPVVAINYAVALAEVEGPEAGLAALPQLADNPELVEFQPFHAARAELLSRAGNFADAAVAYQLAIGLETDQAVRRYLQARANSKIH